MARWPAAAPTRNWWRNTGWPSSFCRADLPGRTETGPKEPRILPGAGSFCFPLVLPVYQVSSFGGAVTGTSMTSLSQLSQNPGRTGRAVPILLQGCSTCCCFSFFREAPAVGECVYDEESKCGQRANSRLCLYLPQVTPGAKTDSGCTVSPSVSAPVGASVHWAVSFCVHGQGETQGMNSRWDARQAFLREGAVCRGAPDHLLPWHSDPPKFAAQPTKFTDLPALKVSIRVGSL